MSNFCRSFVILQCFRHTSHPYSPQLRPSELLLTINRYTLLFIAFIHYAVILPLIILQCSPPVNLTTYNISPAIIKHFTFLFSQHLHQSKVPILLIKLNNTLRHISFNKRQLRSIERSVHPINDNSYSKYCW